MTFCTNYSKSSYDFTTGAIILKRGGVVIQKLIVMQIMQIETRLQCLSLTRYLFYLQFKAFPKQNDISIRKSQKCAFSCTAAIFSHTTVLPFGKKEGGAASELTLLGWNLKLQIGMITLFNWRCPS